MSRGFGPQRSSAGIPITQLEPEAASQTFKPGALLIRTAGNLVECGADPALVGYVSLGSGQDHGTAAIKYTEAHLIADKHEYDAILVGTLAAADVGVAYGVVKAGDGFWKLDKTETVATIATITSIPSTSTVGAADQVVTCTFLTSRIQFP